VAKTQSIAFFAKSHDCKCRRLWRSFEDVDKPNIESAETVNALQKPTELRLNIISIYDSLVFAFTILFCLL